MVHRINDVYETVLKLYLNGREQKIVCAAKNHLYRYFLFFVTNCECGCYCDDLSASSCVQSKIAYTTKMSGLRDLSGCGGYYVSSYE